jgi:hypothetical protein
MDRNQRIAIIVVAAIAVGVISLQLATPSPYSEGMWTPRRGMGMGPGMHGDLEVYYTAKTFISSVNAVLLLGLLIIYVGIYNQVRSEFTVGLIVLNVALLLYALTSNPLIHRWLGFMGSGLGPFAMVPDFFTLIASAILLYLSLK